MSVLKSIQDSTFESDVLQASTPVVLDFWAPWCGPCLMVGPILEEVQTELEGSVLIYKLNIDENPKTPTTYGIRSIPTLVLFKEGQVLSTLTGVRSKVDLINWIGKTLVG